MVCIIQHLEPCNMEKILKVLNSVNRGATKFTKACAQAGIKPIQWIFWKNLPFIDIYHLITPDILHQLYQGILKHLISWIQAACGDAEIDAWCCCLPPNHHIQLFMKGISQLLCYWHRAWSNFEIFFGIGCWHSSSWWSFQYSISPCSLCSSWFHLSS